MASKSKKELNKTHTTENAQPKDDDIYLCKKDDGDFGNNAVTNFCDTESLKTNSETIFPPEDVPISRQKNINIGQTRIHSNGRISYKKINTSQIMESVQLGIQRSVGSLSSRPERDVLMVDFMTVESTPFISEPSQVVSNRKPEFIFKTYAPVAFKHLRELFGIKPDNFVSSFCQASLRELANAGKSGSVFYLTQNDVFIIKTVQHREAEFLQKLLPGYFLNLSQNPHTLLPKFFGLYCYKQNTTNMRLVIMNNVLPSDRKIHQKYDLKGSTHMRKASKTELKNSSPTYKDLDFIDHHPDGIFLHAEVHKNLMKTIKRDCRVMESFRIMDYSLLLGIHYVGEAKPENSLDDETIQREGTGNNSVISAGDGNDTHCEAGNVISKESDCKISGTLKDSKEKQEPSSAEHNKHILSIYNGIPAKKANGEKLLLFLGIIDILQSYRLKKKVEHVLKSIVYESDNVSVHNPTFYARRFEDFLAKQVFKVLPSSPKIKKKKSPLIDIKTI